MLGRHLPGLTRKSLIVDSARSGDPELDPPSVGSCSTMEAAMDARQRLDYFSVSSWWYLYRAVVMKCLVGSDHLFSESLIPRGIQL
jgi:hypothetical protein